MNLLLRTDVIVVACGGHITRSTCANLATASLGVWQSAGAPQPFVAGVLHIETMNGTHSIGFALEMALL